MLEREIKRKRMKNAQSACGLYARRGVYTLFTSQRERKRKREREKQREREREKEREIKREREKEREREKKRKREIGGERKTAGEIERKREEEKERRNDGCLGTFLLSSSLRFINTSVFTERCDQNIWKILSFPK